MEQKCDILQPVIYSSDKKKKQKSKHFPILWNLLLMNGAVFLFSFIPHNEGIITTSNEISGEWILDKTVNNVECYYMRTECNGKIAVFLKFINKNNYKVKIGWKETITTQLEKNANGFGGPKQIVLSKLETAENNCKVTKFKEGRILPEDVSPTYIADIKAFEFTDIKVVKAN